MNPTFVRTTIERDILESTSDLAKELAVEGWCDLPLVVRAARQTRGRGRGTHTWWSDEGSLTFTLVIDPAAHALRLDHEPRLALATAVAIVEAVLELAPLRPPGIRWPNDVEMGGLKVAGILPERVETPHGTRLAIGIGLNVATDLVVAPPEVRRMATSLRDWCEGLGGDPLDCVYRSVLGHFERMLERLSRDDAALAERWDELDLLRGESVRVLLGPRVLTGIGGGIDADGALRLLGEEGLVRLFGGQVLREA